MSQSEDHEALVAACAKAMFEPTPAIQVDVRAYWRGHAKICIALIAKTLETVTPAMAWDGFDQLDMEASPHAAEACWYAMLAASPLLPPRNALTRRKGRDERD